MMRPQLPAQPRRWRALAFWMAWLVGLMGNGLGQNVRFVGTRSFDQETLRTHLADQLTEMREQGLTVPRADDAAFYLASFYRSRGYAVVKVDYQIQGGTLILTVREGPQTLIRSIRFEGNRSFPPERLTEYVSGTKPEELAKAKLPHSEKWLSEAADRVRGFYVSEGFLDAVVETTGTQVVAGGTAADIVLSIREGIRYTFGRVTFTRGTGFSDAQLIEGLGAKPEGAFTGYTVDAMERSLKTWLRGKGYFAVDVDATWDKAKAAAGRVNVDFKIERGAQYRVGNITIRGVNRVRPRFMERRLAGLRGEIYNPEEVDERYRELQRTGLFRRVRIAPKTTGPNTLDLDVEVEEAKHKEVGIELGYGSYDGIIAGIRYSDRNFLGWGRPISLRLEHAQRGFRGELLYIDPWWLETDWALRARLYSEKREERGYERVATGLRLDFSRKLTQRWEVAAFTEIAHSTLTSTGIEEALIGPPDYVLFSVGLTSTLDYRDDPLNPRRGWILGNSIEVSAVDNEIAFTRMTARYSAYRSLGKTLLAFGLRAGWIIPAHNASDIPIDQRYFIGGATTVRSFPERELGPRDRHGHPVGGTWYTVANLEWNFPIVEAVDVALFFDAGNLYNDEAPGISDMRYAIGAGLRYRLPVGPLRLDYGYNPDRREHEPMGALHLSFGFAF